MKNVDWKTKFRGTLKITAITANRKTYLSTFVEARNLSDFWGSVLNKISNPFFDLSCGIIQSVIEAEKDWKIEEFSPEDGILVVRSQ